MNCAFGVRKETLDDYEFSKQIYFKVLKSGQNYSFNSNAWKCPTDVRVAPPTQTGILLYGDILNRKYEVQLPIQVQLATGKNWSTAKVWMDKTSTLKSIRAEATNDGWKGLVLKPDNTDNTTVPQSMRDKVRDAVLQSTKLTDDYFGMVLLRLQNFLQTIHDELAIGDMKVDVANLCKFKYDVDATFDKYTGDWNSNE